MEKSFAGLLRNSRLASYDRKLGQVYEVSRKNQKKGNWGLKRNLPSVIRTPFVTIGDLDTAEHQTPWQSGTSKVMFVRRWKENFPNSRRPAPRPEHVDHNVALMTPADFKRFVKSASKRAPQFQQEIKDKKLKPEQVYEYLGATFSDTPSTSVVGPTYSEHDVGMNYPVEGRFLNVDRQGYAVGVAGIVALCQKRYMDTVRYHGDRRQRVFYVEDASIDAQGRPAVMVRPNQPGSSSIPAILGTNERYTAGSMNASDMFNTSRSRTRNNPPREERPDNSQENPHHEVLMEQFNVLKNLEKKKDE
ncbi:hypothetical protein BDB00DRAFT_775303 [Zychaea mexicana]|uniref:uncharacterized protein n=1 Tax=Zychaea mexicana TaxID=64656 RepID=UPI0022FE9BA8|nr:uncharacterized protein BDB00DRAFT_775303 [Zychaea mexicana]KAI9482580.1 hypothetical protein BDB00DRAFT_775303 [Zychaea mexicana]